MILTTSPCEPANTPAADTEAAANISNPESSSHYYQDQETGEWKIVNPAGSLVYNYLTRDDLDWD